MKYFTYNDKYVFPEGFEDYIHFQRARTMIISQTLVGRSGAFNYIITIVIEIPLVVGVWIFLRITQ